MGMGRGRLHRCSGFRIQLVGRFWKFFRKLKWFLVWIEWIGIRVEWIGIRVEWLEWLFIWVKWFQRL
jgi:hypothetical protein